MASEHSNGSNEQSATGTSIGHEHAVDPALLNAMQWRQVGPFRGGRVVAVAGDPVTRRCSTSARRAAASGRRPMAASTGRTSPTASSSAPRSARSPSRPPTPTSSTSAWARPPSAATSRTATASTSPPTPARPGRTWAWRRRATSARCASTRATPTSSTSPRSATRTAPTRSAASTARATAAQTWEHVLFRSRERRRHDLSMDPNNPRVLYAAFWEARRVPYALMSGGAGQRPLQVDRRRRHLDRDHAQQGAAEGRDRQDRRRRLAARARIASAPSSRPRTAASSAPTTAARRWERLSDERNLRQRAWYYMHIIADPQRRRHASGCSTSKLWRSIDGGKTFAEVAIPHGDNHDLWIDPRDPQRMIEGNDGGGDASRSTAARPGRTIYNQPTARVLPRHHRQPVPYRVYGAQQDNTTITVPSRSNSRRHHPRRSGTRSAAARAATSPCGPTTPTSSTPAATRAT